MILSEDDELLRDVVAKFSDQKLQPNSRSWEQDRAYPSSIFDELGELGLFGMAIEEQYCGSNLGYVSFVTAIIEIARGDGGLSTIISVHNSLAASILQGCGSIEQRQRFLTPMAIGKMIGGFALTEPHTGSDAAAIRTRAVRDGDEYILNGAKQFITSGKIGGVILTFAVTDPDQGRSGISCFAVEPSMPGYVISRVEDKFGQKASDTCALTFEDMRVPSENLIGPEGAGYKIALSNLEGGRLGIAAQSIGMATAALDCAVNYAKERASFGKAIFDHQAVGFRLAEAATKLEAGRTLLLHSAAMKDAGIPCLKEACMAKLFASEIAEEICSLAMQTLGGYGYLEDFPIEKIARDVRVAQIYEGTSDIQKMIIARHLY